MKKVLSITVLLLAALAFISCDKDGGPEGHSVKVSDLVLDFDKSVIQASGDDYVTFKVFYKGEDVSSSADLFLIKGEKDYKWLNSKSFSVSSVGEYTFQATYGAEVSDVVKIKAISWAFPAAPADPAPANTSFVHRTFFNQHTGAQCQNCPFMTYLLKKTLTDDVKDKVVLASIRNFSGESGFASIPNPISSWPYLEIDHVASYPYNASESGLKNIIEQQTATPAVVGISATPEYHEEDGQIVVTVAVKAAQTNEYNLGLWLLQDNYKKTQLVDNSRLSALGPEGFTSDYHYHNNCVRIAESRYLGYDLGYPLGKIETGQTKQWRFVFNVNRGVNGNLESSWWKGKSKITLSDLHFAAFVTTSEVNERNELEYEVVNAIDFKYNEARPFDYIK